MLEHGRQFYPQRQGEGKALKLSKLSKGAGDGEYVPIPTDKLMAFIADLERAVELIEEKDEQA